MERRPETREEIETVLQVREDGAMVIIFLLIITLYYVLSTVGITRDMGINTTWWSWSPKELKLRGDINTLTCNFFITFSVLGQRK